MVLQLKLVSPCTSCQSALFQRLTWTPHTTFTFAKHGEMSAFRLNHYQESPIYTSALKSIKIFGYRTHFLLMQSQHLFIWQQLLTHFYALDTMVKFFEA